MQSISRRGFLKKSMLTTAGVSAATVMLQTPSSKILGANDRLRVGVIGIRGKGGQHMSEFHKMENVDVVALCDIDEAVLGERVHSLEEDGVKVKAYTDFRDLLDNDDIDAVSIATPNHSHSLIAIMAILAGKDVYVEKPVSQVVWEGRRLVDIAKKYNKIVQSGTQNRSDVGLRGALEYLREGHLGKILWAHGLWYKERQPIGNANGPQPIPETIDYNLWTGPAPLVPLMRERLHYDWHWNWDTGNGDMGNLGVHQIDDCRFLMDQKGLPRRLVSFGERFVWDDDGETPNVQFSVFDTDPAPIFIEIRNLPAKAGVRAMDHLRGVRMGNIIQCEDGFFAGGRGGGWFYDNDRKKIKQFPGDGGGEHHANFIQAVRERDPQILHAPIEEGHYSSAFCHMANTSYRLGKYMDIEQIKAQYTHDQALETIDRIRDHLLANNVDLSKTPIKSGPWLEIDTKKEMFKGEMSFEANMFIRRNDREPFVVPAKT
ncbi:twin-arginine translocation signal domain-containing protein [candidate division KSB1 bacterium]|nr:twin-arginine translocation signal domain-containing protein [candidate division KSB1 bacterium]